jgi:drug/metabolite transporter (DMT)-like permease
MAVSALLLSLAAAVVHAAWNLLLGESEDTQAATAVSVTAGVVVFAPLALIHFRLEPAALPYVAASAALELIYLALLATAYSLADVGFVYPIARGSAPVLVLAIGALALGAGVSALAVGGVLLVSAGIVLVRGLQDPGHPRDLALALAVGACIAGYTLIDKHGVAHGSPLSYLQAVFGLTSLGYVFGALRVRGPSAIRAAAGWRPALAGVGFFGSYTLALAALQLASAASVAAVRETSVVMAAAFLAVSGREHMTPARLGGAVAVAAGIACVALG